MPGVYPRDPHSLFDVRDQRTPGALRYQYAPCWYLGPWPVVLPGLTVSVLALIPRTDRAGKAARQEHHRINVVVPVISRGVPPTAIHV
jgi:hypothetical protein